MASGRRAVGPRRHRMSDDKTPKPEEETYAREDFFRDLKKASRKLEPEKPKPRKRPSGRSPKTT